MKRRAANRILSIVTALLVCAVLSLPVGIDSYATTTATSTLAAPGFPHVERASDTSLKLTWSKVSDASGYEVHRYDKKAKKYKKVKTIKGSSTVKWTNKSLKKGTKYTYKIKAYKTASGSKQYSAFTYTVSALPYGKYDKKVNAGKTFGGTSSLMIGIGQVLPVNVTVKPSTFGKNKKKKVVDSNIRLFLNGSTLVGVESGNKLKGKNIGVTNIYAVAHNGNVKKIPVTVVDYAKPAAWINLNKIYSLTDIIVTYKAELTSTVSFLVQNYTKDGVIGMDKRIGASIVNTSNLNIVGMEAVIEEFMTGVSFDEVVIVVDSDYVNIFLTKGQNFVRIGYKIQDDWTSKDYEKCGYIEALTIAPHWVMEWSFGGV